MAERMRITHEFPKITVLALKKHATASQVTV